MRRLALASLLIAALLARADAARAGAPQIQYMLHCQGCHLADGSGSPQAVPALRDFVGNFLRVPAGRQYLVQVPGSAQSPLSDAELAEVLNWMIREFGPAEIAATFEPFGADEVARYRDPPLTDVESVRRELLLAIDRERTGAHGERR
ncbi:MAG: hypothetical protein JSU66_11910 [Deltaproteobacteria bacterium]|nr:MAG: hypothetical protein JSU66_11910 [Deltaproteobacteria bacterium]